MSEQVLMEQSGVRVPGAVAPQVLPQRGRMRVPVQLYFSPNLPPSAEELAALQEIAALQHIAAVAALPDLHIKPRLETPSSLAVGLRDRIALSLSSPSPGCGMALALTGLGEDDLNLGRMDALFGLLAHRLPMIRPGGEALIENIRPALRMGAAAAVNRFDLDPALTNHIDARGDALAALAEPWGEDTQALAAEALSAIPAQLLPLAAREFGSIGRGNHFLELQVVEEVYHPALAEQWGVQPGQVAVMYHADSGRLGAFVGRLYAYRRKNTPRGRLIELRHKLPFHLRRAGSPAELYRQVNYYFMPRRHTLVPSGSTEARRALTALAGAANYAFANRVAVFALLAQALQSVWGQDAAARLLFDVPHNSIRLEEIGGEPLWVHRHNASRALPAGHSGLMGGPFFLTGQPLLLPGIDRTSSYLCAAGPHACDSLYSVDHGAGRSALQLGRSQHGRSTRVYNYSGRLAEERPHLTSDGIDAVVQALSQAGLAAPVARLRPLAVLKDMVPGGAR